VSPRLAKIFQQTYRELRPRTPLPPMHIRFYSFVSINNTIRLRQGELFVRVSDLLEGAPEPVLHAIAHILLAKLYRKPVDRAESARYRRYVASHDIAAKARLVRQIRGRKQIQSASGHQYHLEEIFEDLNRRFFNGIQLQASYTLDGGTGNCWYQFISSSLCRTRNTSEGSQVLNLAYIVAIPKGSKLIHGKVGGAILDNWQIAGNTLFANGATQTVTLATTDSFDFTGGATAAVSMGHASLGRRSTSDPDASTGAARGGHHEGAARARAGVRAQHADRTPTRATAPRTPRRRRGRDVEADDLPGTDVVPSPHGRARW